MLGRQAGEKTTKRGKIGYHSAFDDHSRLAYPACSFSLVSEHQGPTWVRALADSHAMGELA